MEVKMKKLSIQEPSIKELSIQEQKSLSGGQFHTWGGHQCAGLTPWCMWPGVSGNAGGWVGY